MMTLQAFIVGIGMYSFTFWVEPWMAEFDASRRDVMTAITLMAYASGLMSLFTGRWIDFYPARYIVMAGMACFTLAMVLVSIAPNLQTIWLIYAFILPAASATCGPLVSMVLVTRGFNRRRGMALSIVTLGTSIGGIFFPGLIAFMLAELGWRPSFAILGLSGGILLLPLIWIILGREPARETAQARSGQDGAGFRDFASHRAFWALAIIFLFTWLLFTSVQHNTKPFASDLGISIEGTASFMSALALCMVIGKLLLGALADRVDNRHLFFAASLLLVAGVVSLSLSSAYVPMLVSYVIIGTAAGCFLPLQGTLFAATFGPEAMGRAMGMAAPIQSISAVGAFLAGWYRDEMGTYTTFFQLTALGFFLIIPLMLLIPRQSVDVSA